MKITGKYHLTTADKNAIKLAYKAAIDVKSPMYEYKCFTLRLKQVEFNNDYTGGYVETFGAWKESPKKFKIEL